MGDAGQPSIWLRPKRIFIRLPICYDSTNRDGPMEGGRMGRGFPKGWIGKGFFLALLFFLGIGRSDSLGPTEEEIRSLQASLQDRTTGERIAFWAEKFVGVPYDEDPRGIYVTEEKIVFDHKVDCMYLVFRSVELALSRTPEEAVAVALEKRFHGRGQLRPDGSVANYHERFQYGEDMILSGKWGRDITGQVGPLSRIPGPRGKKSWQMIATRDLMKGRFRCQTGDLIFFVVAPGSRKADEIIGHLGIIKVEKEGENARRYLIHASGVKGKGGVVKKVRLQEYFREMPFIGANLTRFEP